MGVPEVNRSFSRVRVRALLWSSLTVLGCVVFGAPHAAAQDVDPDDASESLDAAERVSEEVEPDDLTASDAARTDPSVEAIALDDVVVEEAQKPALNKAPEPRVRLSPIIAPGYTPELQFLLAVGGLLSFQGDPSHPELRRSSVTLTTGLSSTLATITAGRFSGFFLNDALRVYSDLYVKYLKDHYFGVGYHAARYTKQGEDTTEYRRLWWTVNPVVLVRLIPNFYLGPNLDINQTRATELSPGVAMDEAILRDGTNNFNVGLGITAQYDSRDVPVNAYQGLLVSASLTEYSGLLGSQNNYRVLNIDYRQYQTIGRPGSTLAWQLRYRGAFADVPWAELSLLGTPFDLRGYRWGRYRDRTMLFGIVEYRHMFRKIRKRNEVGRHGVVGWLGTGSIASRVKELKHWLPNGGLGYRFELQPRMNLRFDVGATNDGVGVYLNFNEAF